jgi:hypothetical protein
MYGASSCSDRVVGKKLAKSIFFSKPVSSAVKKAGNEDLSVTVDDVLLNLSTVEAYRKIGSDL